MTESDGRLPRYDDLPVADLGGRSGWGLFGPDDSLGLMNQQTPETVLAATRLVRRGAVFPLDAALDAVDPPLAVRRGKPRHTLIHGPGPVAGLDDVYDNFNPQTSSQWDSLAHMAYSPGSFYNGATEEDVLTGRRNTIDFWARQGIVALAIVLDVARALPAAGREYRPGTGTAFTVDDLELARSVTGLSYSPGCILLLHTGFLGWYTQQPYEDRAD
ncbi:MAG TPA: cyclase family protein, partial [Streptosporangiaceae bacterium]|nr:cyclase family protein [Streptosporangiaceae bacterium]